MHYLHIYVIKTSSVSLETETAENSKQRSEARDNPPFYECYTSKFEQICDIWETLTSAPKVLGIG